MARILRWSIGAVLLQGSVLVLLAWALPGLTIGNLESTGVAAMIFTLTEAATWPLAYRLATRFRPLLFPVLSLLIASVQVSLLSDVITDLGIGDVHVASAWTGMLVSLGLTVGGTLLGAVFSLRDDTAYDWFVSRPLRLRYASTAQRHLQSQANANANAPGAAAPIDAGVLFLEIDGLAEPILRQALADGRMPTLARWLAEGSHTLTAWEPDLSSQTSASQAGILLGDNHNIPAFRWFDKTTGTLRVSSNMTTARELEQELSTGTGLLRDGASRWNVFSGDAPDAICTYSTFGVPGSSGSGAYLAYFANPYTLPRALALFLSDVVRERWQAWRQVRRDEQPRMHRTMTYAAVRAATTTLMQEAALFMVLSDLYRGVPAVYTTFFAYDEVAHHSGIDRDDALKVLTTLDRVIATLERAVHAAPRPYHLVVLSDHGQTMGATFRQRTGRTLGQLVTSLVHPTARLTIDEHAVEDWGHVNVALQEALAQRPDDRTTTLLRRTLARPRVAATVEVGPAEEARAAALAQAAQESDVVVLASGNMGLISFPQWPERVTYEQIVDHFPALIPGLVAQEWIGFLLVQSDEQGGLVIGKAGMHYLEHGYTVGDDPLAGYGPRAADHLRRTHRFTNAPDLLVMSHYDPQRDEVAAFEELVGSHGGLGGMQTQPFVVHPASLPVPKDLIVGAAQLHQVLRQWLPSPQSSARREA